MILLTDLTFWSYSLCTLLSIYGFILFAWWWWKIGKASEVYIYITLLFLGNFLFFAGSLHARILRFTNPQEALKLVDSFIWSIRTYLHTIITILIVVRMTRRAMRIQKYTINKKNRRRIDDETI